jgi:hypothetical protein
MVNHKVCHLQQRLVTIDIYARFEVTLRVHFHESFKEVPLEQTFPMNSGEILEMASGISLCDLQPFCR